MNWGAIARFDGLREAEFPGTVHVAGTYAGRYRAGLYFDVCVKQEKNMNQKLPLSLAEARPEAFLCREALQKEGYRVAVDIQSDKTAANVARKLTPILAKVWRTVLAPTPPASRESVLALSRGVDEISGASICWFYSAGIAKAAFISDFQWAVRPLATGESGGLFHSAPVSFPA